MLTIYGNKSRFCDGISRRNFLKVGSLALGGLTLSQLLRAEAQAGIGKSHKAVIMIFLPGGPSHQDMFDLKQDAPSEIRGEFKPINTNVPGIQICEHMPRIASVMDKLTIIRSMVGAKDNHDAFQCMSGHLTSISLPAAGLRWARFSPKFKARWTRRSRLSLVWRRRWVIWNGPIRASRVFLASPMPRSSPMARARRT